MSGDHKWTTRRGQLRKARGKQGGRRRRQRLMHLESLEARNLLAGGPVLSGITTDDGALLLDGALPRNTAPRSLTLTFDRGQIIDTSTLSAIQVRASGLDGSFNEGNEESVTPGFIGLGDNPNEIIIRFASTLPDEVYELSITGSGDFPLRNILDEPFNMGTDFSQQFELDLGAKVVAVVPQPISRDAGGRLSQARSQIDVYFNNDDLDPSLATDPNFYQLIFTGHSTQFAGSFDTVTNTDDGPVILPTAVAYSAAQDRATLMFADDLADFGVGSYRLRIGNSESIPVPPARVAVTEDAGSSFATANTDLGTLSGQDIILASSIDPQSSTIIFPGSNQDPGHRQVSTTFDLHVPNGGADVQDGITTIFYNFREFYGRSGSGNLLANAINESQKVRAREAFELWSSELGVSFIETESEGFTIATGDLRAIDQSAFTDPNLVMGAAGDVPGADANGIPFGPTAVMNAAARWNDGFGENWFSESMAQIGHLLGLGAAADLPAGTVMSSNSSLTFGREGEAVFPGNHDIVHGQFLYRPDSNDIDLFQFTLAQDGVFTAESIAERLDDPSQLDTFLRLYRQSGSTIELIAQNDDYFNQDSLISLPLTEGTYFIGVSSQGNEDYNPVVPNTGAGGTTQGAYELRLNYRASEMDSLRDATGVALDGDGDNIPGGVYNFWFRTQQPEQTLIVDKATTNAGAGTLAAPFTTINAAVLAASPGDIVRVVGNNFADDTLTNDIPYELGFDSFGNILPDSGDNGLLQVPSGVTLIIDAGSVFKLRSTSIIVGSSSTVVDRSGSALQILGVPDTPVRFTSLNDETIGIDTTPLTTMPRSGDWGGVVFRNDIDSELDRFDYEDQGIFLNYINHAEMAYGGGILSLDSVVGVANPITMVDSRPTVTFNTIINSADGAMSASPDAFEETLFTDPRFQATPFTADYGRVGPEIHDNQLIGNSINGVFVANRFLVSAQGDLLTGSSRWNDTDIVHVVADNLIVAGFSGGPTRDSLGNLTARPDGRLSVDPGIVVKLEDAYIDIGIGANFYAEGTAEDPVIFTSVHDDRYGGGGSFDTNGDGSNQAPTSGDWAGFYLRPTSRGSVDHAVLAYGGGIAPIEGNFTGFNVLEAHQADLRVTRSDFTSNESGFGGSAEPTRAGRTLNGEATIYVSGGQPVILDNRFLDNAAAVVSFDVNSLNHFTIVDQGRQTGELDRVSGFKDNQGPLVRRNIIGGNGINGMLVRGGTLTTESVWDDVDMVHVLLDGVFVPNFHSFGGLRLKSAIDQSLVVKLSGPTAGFTTTGSAVGVADHIGGSMQVIGQPGFPVVMTSLFDDTVGAGFDALGITQTDTDGGGRPTRAGLERPFQIDFNFGPNLAQNAEAVAAIRRAADAWEAELNDAMTVVIDIELGTFSDELFTGTAFSLGAQLFDTTIEEVDVAYDTARNAMVFDAGAHETMLGQLPTSSELQVTLPDASLGAFGLSTDMRLTRSNAKALGLAPGTGTPSQFDANEIIDGTVLVNANLDLFDLDRKDGLQTYQEDFQTQIMRQIGSILGFRSGVDQVTAALQGFVGDGEIQMSPLDLFRFAPGDGGTDFTNSPRQLDPRALNHVFYAGDSLDFRDLPFDDMAKGDIPLATGFRRAGELNDAFGAGFWRDELQFRQDEITTYDTIGLMDPASLLRDEIIYEVDPIQSTAGVLVNISEADRLAFDSIGYDVVGGAPGDWQGIRLEELTHDGNVPVLSERETPDSPTTTNSTTSSAEFLGRIAPNEKSGDENSRLGFQVEGTISQPSDVDVYSFKAIGGTTVYIDIDRTGVGLDSIVELVSPDGTILARSNDSEAEFADPALLVGIANPLDSRDIYTTNPRDAAMKVDLPGSTNLEGVYHVRVRSAGADLNVLTGGLTDGRYQLQIRLQAEDEVPGTSIGLADIRYAETGITVVGPPSRSALGGEQTEDGTLNDVVQEIAVSIVDQDGMPVGPPPEFIDHGSVPINIEAQNLGNVLATRQGATSVFGTLSDTSDVDWYRVDFSYNDLQPSFATNLLNPDLVGVVFDIDYANGFGRADTNLSVFNEVGQLVYFSDGSNLADDQAAPGQGADLDDLSRGSAGVEDPFIGPVVLAAGRQIEDFGSFGTFFGTGVFYVVVSSAQYAPDPIVNGTAVLQPIGLANERGLTVTGTNPNDTLFDRVLGAPGAITTGEYSLEIRTVPIPGGGFTPANITLADKNLKREQGLISISSNQITNSREWGVAMEDGFRDLPDYPGDIAELFERLSPVAALSGQLFASQPHTQFSTGDYVPHSGAPRLLPTINEERQIAGITIANNVIAGGMEGGISLQGDPGGVVLTLPDFADLNDDYQSTQVIGGSEFTLWDHNGQSATFQFEPAAPENIPIRWDFDATNDGGDIDSTSFATSVGGPTTSDRLADEVEHAIRRSGLDVRVFQSSSRFGGFGFFGGFLSNQNSTLFVEGVAEVGHPDIFGGRNSAFVGDVPGETIFPYITAEFVQQGAVPYVRVVNNTLVGRGGSLLDAEGNVAGNGGAGDIGVLIEDNISPTLLNNIISNFDVGIRSDQTSTDSTTPRRTFVGSGTMAPDVFRISTVAQEFLNNANIDINTRLMGTGWGLGGFITGEIGFDRNLLDVDFSFTDYLGPRPTVVGSTVYQGNNTDTIRIGRGDSAIRLNNSAPLFVDASIGNYFLATGSRAIDSSLDRLAERDSYRNVAQAVGINSAGILAPATDALGVQRVDDPDVEPPGGAGQNVFKDRGALERADFVGPQALLVTPIDNDPAGTDFNPAMNDVALFGSSIDVFDVRFSDAATPANPTFGTGIDDLLITEDVIRLLRNDVELVAGVDYAVTYDVAADLIRLTSITGIWLDGQYRIELDNTVIRDRANNLLQPNRVDGSTSFSILLGPGFDFGDAPESYGTLLADDGARHLFGSNLFLGDGLTPEADGQPSSDASLDLQDDGVALPDRLFPGNTISLEVTASRAGFLNGWIDYNIDGVFDTTEQVVFNAQLSAGLNSVGPVTVATDTNFGNTFARFRFSSATGLGPTGQAQDGEVEDYIVQIGDSNWQNTDDPFDVDANGAGATPLDALTVINELTVPEFSDPVTGRLPTDRQPGDPFLDVNGDGFVSPIDALLVINRLPSSSAPAGIVVYADDLSPGTPVSGLDPFARKEQDARAAIDEIFGKFSGL